MRSQRGWPVRYSVTAWVSADEHVEYRVLTWYGEEKAIALAVRDFLRQHDSLPVDLAVAPLGDAPKNERGTVAVGADLHDRSEF